MAVALRRGDLTGPRIEFLVGAFVAWLVLTLTRRHDLRYDMPLLPYLAVIGTGWIVYLNRAARVIATAALVLAVAANTLATTFGVGGRTEIALVGTPPANPEALPDRVVLYSNTGYLVAGPQRDGDVLGLLRALRRDGVRVVTVGKAEYQGGGPPDFSTSGVIALALIARIDVSSQTALVHYTNPRVVALVHRSIASGAPPACTRLSDGTGVWVVRFDPAARRLSLYCPFRHPHFYGPNVGTTATAGPFQLP